MKFSVKAAASVSSLLSSTSAQSLCSCSPRKYAFTLSLSQACGDDTIQNSPGVFTTICSTDTNLEAYDDWSDLIPDVGESLVRRALHGKHKRQMATDHMTPVKIISIVFAEVNLDGSLVIINKDESFAGVDLHDGAVVEFDSISSALDPSVGIEDQLSSVPGGVTVLLVGENASGDLVKSQILWLYTNDCSTVPLVEAGNLGWISIDTLETASVDFCHAISGTQGEDSSPSNTVESKAEKSATSKLFPKSGKSASNETIISTSQSAAIFTKAGKVFNTAGKAKAEKIIVRVESGKDAVIATEANTTNEARNEFIGSGTRFSAKKLSFGSKSRKRNRNSLHF